MTVPSRAAAPRTPASTPAPVPATHACVRCGVQVPLDVALCERCNPLGLPQPATSQAHGTVAVGIVLAVIVLAVLGRVALAGVGPFNGTIAGVVSNPPNLSVTLAIRNDGTRDGSATCRIFDPAAGGGIAPGSAFVTSPSIPAGASLTFSRLVTTLGSNARPLGVDCATP